jgi:ABC-2 type transport system permease protein
MRKEVLQVFRDPPTLVQVLLIPLIQLVVLANAATFDTGATRLLVRDDDRTPASAAMVAEFVGTGEFIVVGTAIAPERIEAVLRRREAAAVLHIPAGFASAIARGERSAVQLQINAEEGAVAGLIQQAAQAIIERQAGAPRTLEVRQRGWFNPTRRYKDWMVPGILVSLTTIIGLLLTAQSITREKELGTLEQLNVTPITKGELITAKLLPFWGIAMGIFTVGLIVAKLVFAIPTVGAVPIVFLAAMVYLMVALGIGLWISTVTQTQQQAMFVAFFVLLIFLLMSGLFTPLEAMPDWAQAVAHANPVMHFVGLMRAVLVRGAGLAEVGPTIMGLGVAGAAVLGLAVLQTRKTLE